MLSARANTPARGETLIESLIALALMAFGLLGMVKLQGDSVVHAREAQYRAEAQMLAHELIGTLWTDRANLAAYAHRPGGSVCTRSGANTSLDNAGNWLAEFTSAGGTRYLPGATADMQQIVVDATTTPPTVRVHLCWQPPQAAGPSNVVVVAQIPL